MDDEDVCSWIQHPSRLIWMLIIIFFLSSEELSLSLGVRAGVRAAVVVAAREGKKKETPSPPPARALSFAARRRRRRRTTSGGYGGLPCPTSVGRTSQRPTFKASDDMGKFLFSFTFFFFVFVFVCICCGSGAGVVGLWSSCCHPRACI